MARLRKYIKCPANHLLNLREKIHQPMKVEGGHRLVMCTECEKYYPMEDFVLFNEFPDWWTGRVPGRWE
jgi:hypothetical protein